ASRPFLTSSKFRVASMTKSVVALAAIRLAQSGEVSLDADVSDYLGYAFRHPYAPDRAITLTMLLAHTSGVTDPDNYWSVPSGQFRDLLTPNIFRPLGSHRLGEFFEYANINFGIAAAALESAAGERFDHLTKRLALDPLDLDVGLNWSGVSPEMRALGASLYRRDDAGDWRIQIDGPDMLTSEEPAVLLYGDATLEAYQIGANGALFSPQGGLRASLEDLVIIAEAVQRSLEMRQPIWTRDAAGDNGIHDDSFFQSIGLGSFLYKAQDSPWTGKDIIGHHGEAYGLHGAYWATLDEDIQIAYAAVGIPEIPPMRAVHPALNIYTAPLMALAQDALA
ncbi:MAG: serine hydrolase domain-containing protein, partial [Pseudomonadota bacterium]